jgi:hypothetical protein
VLVSTTGGDVPRWRADGRELFYRTPDGAIVAAVVTLGDDAELAKPRVVAATPPFDQSVRALSITPDGREFKCLRPRRAAGVHADAERGRQAEVAGQLRRAE